jgi:serine/threonine-protein kinase
VIDAGRTEDGRPFLVMEYVEGVPVDVYAAGIDVRDRLKLFLRVCEGVSHAHRHLIIHRDLKPSNILVGSTGQPKLLDFGIAKLLDETGDATQTVERLLTPNYASPEQKRGEAQTTATDVYSLGAVLYQLLTGVGPREKTRGAAKGETAPPSQLNRDVPSDLDFIVSKALRPEPEDRYASVDELAADIRAALDWRPVAARSGDAWYRTRRFLRRYWMPVAAGAIAIASLATGVYVANRERAVAQRRFLEVRQLANKLFDIDLQVAQLPGGSKTRQLIVDTSLEYLRRVTADVRMDPDLALEVGTAFMRAARVQGVNISPNLGQTDQADQTEAKAQGLIDSVLAKQPGNRIALLRAAQIAHDRMTLAGDRHQDAEALRFAAKAAARVDQYLRTGPLNEKSDRMEAQQAIIALSNAANRYRLADQYDEAIRLCGRAIEMAHATNWPTQAGSTLMIVALAQRSKGNLDEALAAVRESVRLLEPAQDEKRTGRLLPYALALMREGQILGEDGDISLGRSNEAVGFLKRALDIAVEFARRDETDFASQNRVFNAETKLAAILRHTDPHRALELYDDALQRLTRLKGNGGTRINEVHTLAGSTYPLMRLGRAAEARKRLDSAFEILRELKLYPAEKVDLGSPSDDVLRALADYEAAKGDARHAAEIYHELLRRIFAAASEPVASLSDAVELSNIYRAAAPLYRRAGRADPAAALEARRCELWQRWIGKLPHSAFVQRQFDTASLS